MQKNKQEGQNQATAALRRELPTSDLLEIAPRLSKLFSSAFAKTFRGTFGQEISLFGPFSPNDLRFTLFENRAGLNGVNADKVPELCDFLCSTAFLGNLSRIAPKYSFRHLIGLKFLDVKNNVEVEIMDYFSIDW